MSIKRKALVAFAVAGLTTVSLAASQTSAPPLLTAEQQQVDRQALALLGDPAIKAAREAGYKLLSASSPASIEDGRSQLEGALDEAVFFAVRSAVAGDPADPKIVWIESPSYSWGDVKVPGGRVAGDSPDRIYRLAAVDPKHRYTFQGRRNPQPSLEDFSFEAHVDGQPRAVLNSKDIDIGPDGSFTVAADSTPTDGRRNHLALPAGTTAVLIRDTLVDWSKQLPNDLTIKRTDDVAATPRSNDAVVHQAAETAEKIIRLNLKYVEGAWKIPVNVVKPFVRTLEDGVPGTVIALARFSLKDDEALVITADPGSAKYVGFQLTDPWFRSIPYWDVPSSLSNLQAKRNPDGSLTYVLARKDPGYHNWVSTGGLREGLLLLRVESFSEQPDLNKLVRQAQVVNLADLPKALPGGVPQITPEQRAQQLAERSAGYLKRIAR